MTKTEFLLTISIQYQAKRDENKENYQLGDYWLNQYQILQTNTTRTIWQIVRRISREIIGVKGLSGVLVRRVLLSLIICWIAINPLDSIIHPLSELCQEL